MQKKSYFASEHRNFWPPLEQLKPYFIPISGPPGFTVGGNDTGGFRLEGVDGTENFEPGKGRIDISLQLTGHPNYGVFLFYRKTRGPMYSSKGDLTKMKTYVRTEHYDLLTQAFFIPFDQAWLAVKEFIETDGQLPKSIEWVNMKDVEGEPFPDPRHKPGPGETIIEQQRRHK